MRIYTVLCTLLLVFSACGSKDDETVAVMEQPEDLIQRDSMIQIIADVHLLEAALQYRSPRGPSRTPFGMTPEDATTINILPTDQKTLPYYDIFVKHGATREQYERSLQWYMTDAAEYGLMYDEVINELIRRQAYEQQKTAIKPTDSVR